MTQCADCQGVPCICHYIAKLADGVLGHAMTAVAVDQMTTPTPHRGGCPCPECYRDRLRSWGGVDERTTT